MGQIRSRDLVNYHIIYFISRFVKYKIKNDPIQNPGPHAKANHSFLF